MAVLKDGSYYRDVATKIRNQRSYLYACLKKLGLNFIESYTNFILVEVGNAAEVAKKLLKKGVIIRDMNAWGLQKYIRVSIGTAPENRRLIKTLKEIL